MKATGKNSKRNLQDKGEKKKKRKEKVKKTLSKIAKGVLPSAAGLAMGALIGPASGPLCSFITSQLLKLNISIGADKVAEIAEELVSTTAEESADAILTRKIKEEASIDGKQIKTLLKNQTNEISELNNKIKLAVQSSLRPALDGIKEGMSFIRKFPSETVEILAETQNGKFQELSEKFSHYLDAHFEDMSRQLKGTERQLGLKIDSLASQLSDLFELLTSNSGKKLDKNSAIALCYEQLSSEVKSSRWDSPYKTDLYVHREVAENNIWDFIRDINNSYGASANIFTLLAGIGIGKTWLMAHMADELIQSGYPALFFTLKSGGVLRISRVLGANSQRDSFNIICNIAAVVKKPIFLFLDGLDEMPVANRPSIIQWAIDIRACMGRYNIGIFISSRQYDWETNIPINESISKNPGVFYQIGEKDGTSILLPKFSIKEMNDAAENYGISEKLRDCPKLMDYAKYPFILRLFGEHCKESHNNLPDPNKITEFMRLFYSPEKTTMSKTIMGRMGIRGPWLGKLGKILSCCEKNALILDEDERMKKGIPQKDIDYVVSCGLFIREFGFIESIKINPIYSDYIRELARIYNLKFKDEIEIIIDGPDPYQFAKAKIISCLKKNNLKDAKTLLTIEIQIADDTGDSKTFKKLSDLEIELIDYISKYEFAISEENKQDNIKAYISWKELSKWCKNTELNELIPILQRNVKKYRNILEDEFRTVRKNANNVISNGKLEETLIQLNLLKELSVNGILQEEESHISGQIIACENAIQFNKLRNNFGELIIGHNFSKASKTLKILSEISTKDGINEFIPDILNIILEMESDFKNELNSKISDAQTDLNRKNFENALSKLDEALNYGQQHRILEKSQEQDIKNLISECKRLIKLSKLKEYDGILLNGSDWQVLNEFQEMVGEIIPVVSEINWDTFGFTHENLSVTGLGLYKKGLSFLPESIGGLKSLENLNLYHNKLTPFPKIITKMTWLKVLNIEDNDLTSFPKSLGNLKKLEKLWLSNNKLTFLPKSISNLTALKELHLNQNQLSSLPEIITKMIWLKVLSIGNNCLLSLPESIGNLKSLKMLSLHNNKISFLPESMGNLKSLKELYLYQNQLSFLPESMGNLKSLKVLYIQSNKLSSLRESIGNLSSLEYLDLESNNIEKLPKSFDKLKLRYNGVLLNGSDWAVLYEFQTIIGEKIPVVSRIKNLSFGFTHEDQSVTGLSLYNKGLSSLPENIGNLKSLNAFWIRNNNLTSLPESLGNLTSLNELIISKNQLLNLPDNIGNLKLIINLDLSDNCLNILPVCLDKLEFLENLFLQNNNLTQIPQSIMNLKKLRHIDITNNKINSLPKELIEWVFEIERNGCVITGFDKFRWTNIPKSVKSKINNIHSKMMTFFELENYNEAKTLAEEIIELYSAQNYKLGLKQINEFLVMCSLQINNEEMIKRSLIRAKSFLKKKQYNDALMYFKDTLYLKKNFKRNQLFIDEINENILKCRQLMNKNKKYHGVLLFEDDYRCLNDIETIIGEEIPVVSEIKYNTFGFTYKNHSVIGLGISGKKMKSVPESIKNLTMLTKLSLSYNLLTSFSNNYNFMNVEWLNLRHNEFSSIDLLIPYLPWLMSLDISENNLTNLPKGMGIWRSLVSLNFSSNKLSSIPDDFYEIGKLEKLDLSFNSIKELPIQFGNLKSLKELELGTNYISYLPKSFGNLKNLEKLDLSDNRLISLPENIGNLKSLKILYLCHNEMKEFPNSLIQLKKLEKLNLMNNKLNSIPEIITSLKWLKSLNLESNKLSYLPISIGNMKSLEELDLDENTLNYFPSEIVNLTSIKNLLLGSILSPLPKTIENWLILLQENGCDIYRFNHLKLESMIWKAESLFKAQKFEDAMLICEKSYEFGEELGILNEICNEDLLYKIMDDLVEDDSF